MIYILYANAEKLNSPDCIFSFMCACEYRKKQDSLKVINAQTINYILIYIEWTICECKWTHMEF